MNEAIDVKEKGIDEGTGLVCRVYCFVVMINWQTCELVGTFVCPSLQYRQSSISYTIANLSKLIYLHIRTTSYIYT